MTSSATSARDSEEWVQFQRDLQKAVVIANDYRNEAQNEVKSLEKDRTDLHEQIKSLSAEVERLRKIERMHKHNKDASATQSPARNSHSENEIRQRMQAIMKSSEKDIVRGSTSRKTLSNGKLSVKNLVKTIESNASADTPKVPTKSYQSCAHVFQQQTSYGEKEHHNSNNQEHELQASIHSKGHDHHPHFPRVTTNCRWRHPVGRTTTAC